MARRKSKLKFKVILLCDEEEFVNSIIEIIVKNLDLPKRK